jgi:high affinity sulfate transporter 1
MLTGMSAKTAKRDGSVRAAGARLLPGVALLRAYERPWLRGDLVAGVTVAAYLIPQVMAYAEVAGLAPVVGLWAIVGTTAVYAIVGSSRQLSVGPESTTALLTATAVAPLAASDPARYAGLAAVLALMVGVMCIVGWAARLGFLAELLSRPVLVGYMAGVAVIMVAGQLSKATGIKVEADSVFGQLACVVTHLGQANLATVLLSTSVLVLLLVGRRLAPKLPVPLMVMLLAAVLVAVLDLGSRGIAVIGSVPAGVPVPRLPQVHLSDLSALLLPALGVTVVGYTDNILTARTFASRNGYAIDANQELLALGAANAASAAMAGFPVSSSGSRTAIGDSLGSRTQLYSLVALVTVTLTLLFGRGVLATFPRAALAALVIWAASGLVDVGEFKRLAHFRRSELILALVTTLGVLSVDILYGVLVAVGLSVLDLLHRVSRPHDGILGYVPGRAGMHDIDDYPDAVQVAGLLVYRYDSPLYFANVEDFRRRALASLDQSDTPTEWLLVNAEANTHVDLTCADALEELRSELKQRGVTLALARVKFEVAEDLRRAGFLDRVGEHRVFETLPTAVAAYVAWYQDRFGATPAGTPAHMDKPTPWPV